MENLNHDELVARIYCLIDNWDDRFYARCTHFMYGGIQISCEYRRSEGMENWKLVIHHSISSGKCDYVYSSENEVSENWQLAVITRFIRAIEEDSDCVPLFLNLP